MSEGRVLTVDEAMELLAFLITSARTQLDEPAIYGPLRLLTATERLSGYLLETATPELRPVFQSFVDNIPEMHMRMTDEDWYREQLDELCKAIATVLVQRSEATS